MGQYYRAVIISGDNVRWVSAYDYENLSKLTEHSYIGNPFVNAILCEIWHKPLRIAWIGDYSDDWFIDGHEPILSSDDFPEIYRKVWGDESDEYKYKPNTRGVLTIKNSSRYLINHDKSVYIDMKTYIERNKWHKEYDYIQQRYKNGKVRTIHADYYMCINPLPLLTACGNGRGSGDYRSNDPDIDKVGTWAFDRIEFTGKKPKTGFEPVTYSFKFG